MSISYENTSRDVEAWYSTYLTRTRVGRRALKSRRIALPALAMLLYVLLSFSMGGNFSLSAVLGAATVMAFASGFFELVNVSPWGVRWITYRMTKKGIGSFASLLGKRQAFLVPEGLRVTSQDGENLRRWTALQHVEEIRDHVFLLYNGVDFVLIPKRAFATEAHRQAFINEVKRYRAEAATRAVVAAPGGALASAAVIPGPKHVPWWRSRDSVDTEATTEIVRSSRPS